MDLFTKANMSNSKEAHTLLLENQSLALIDETFLIDVTSYGFIVGGLQYLLFTRPRIAFLVNKLSQFMHHPSMIHWGTVK